MCRVCKTRNDETVAHIISECSKVAQGQTTKCDMTQW